MNHVEGMNLYVQYEELCLFTLQIFLGLIHELEHELVMNFHKYYGSFHSSILSFVQFT